MYLRPSPSSFKIEFCAKIFFSPFDVRLSPPPATLLGSDCMHGCACAPRVTTRKNCIISHCMSGTESEMRCQIRSLYVHNKWEKEEVGLWKIASRACFCHGVFQKGRGAQKGCTSTLKPDMGCVLSLWGIAEPLRISFQRPSWIRSSGKW